MSSSRLLQQILFTLLILGCTSSWSYGPSMGAPGKAPIPHTAVVKETMSSAGYTYIRVEEEGKTYWIALPETEVSVGEKVSFYEQMLMENFTSRTLNRTFDKILFVEAINKGSEMPTQAKAKASPNKEAIKTSTDTQKPVDLQPAVGRFTVEELFAQKDKLNGEVIELKGKVAKLSQQIMGTDWIHIEDGTGDKSSKTDKIIVRTTQGGISVGDELTAKGVLYVNKDFGHGYFYPVIIEEAIIIK